MHDREAFEKNVNLYDGDIWYKDNANAYTTLNSSLGAGSVRVNEMFRIWQAAKADSKAEIEQLREENNRLKNPQNVPQDLTKIKVTEGGLKIVDFDDLKIAFLDLHDKHQKLAKDYSAFKHRANPVIHENTRYEL